MSAINKIVRSRRHRPKVLTEVNRPEVHRLTRQEKQGMKWKVVLGLLLFPVAGLFMVSIAELFFQVLVRAEFWREESFLFFFMGCFGWFTLAFFKMQPAIAYVFAHEMSHVLATWISLGRVRHMEIGEEGGYVEATKSNWFITLAPYLLPLYLLLVIAVYWCASVLFHDLHREFQLPLYFWTAAFKFDWLFYFWAGMTWAFHVQFTFDVLQIEQSDLRENGEFFSLMLIFLVNLGVLGALFVEASPTVTYRQVFTDAASTLTGAAGLAWGFVHFIGHDAWLK
jgi:hypothetical protein